MDINENHSNQMNTCRFIKKGRPQRQKIQYESLILYPFQSLKPVIIHIMNDYTKLDGIVSLWEQAEQTEAFSIYIKRTDHTNEINSIAIQFLTVQQINSTVITFDLMNRPEHTSYLFTIIKSLLLHIFQPNKRCFIWNVQQNHDLYTLVDYHYISRFILESIQIIQLEPLFKYWYNKTYPHDQHCFVPMKYIDDSICCICPHRPYKNINDEWTLLRALYYTFNEFICTIDDHSEKIPSAIQFSASYCSILTKLAMVIELDWTIEQLNQFKKYHERKLQFNFLVIFWE